MDALQLPPLDYVRQLLRYDPASGKLYWLHRSAEMMPNQRGRSVFNTVYAGREAGSPTALGYCQIGFPGRRMVRAHRVAWLLHYGRQPVGEIDHINGDRSDNRIENLRDVPRSENGLNVARSRTSGAPASGVEPRPGGKWMARVKRHGRYVFRKNFDTLEGAVQAVAKVRAELGFTARHGK